MAIVGVCGPVGDGRDRCLLLLFDVAGRGEEVTIGGGCDCCCCCC